MKKLHYANTNFKKRVATSISNRLQSKENYHRGTFDDDRKINPPGRQKDPKCIHSRASNYMEKNKPDKAER